MLFCKKKSPERNDLKIEKVWVDRYHPIWHGYRAMKLTKVSTYTDENGFLKKETEDVSPTFSYYPTRIKEEEVKEFQRIYEKFT